MVAVAFFASPKASATILSAIFACALAMGAFTVAASFDEERALSSEKAFADVLESSSGAKVGGRVISVRASGFDMEARTVGVAALDDPIEIRVFGAADRLSP